MPWGQRAHTQAWVLLGSVTLIRLPKSQGLWEMLQPSKTRNCRSIPCLTLQKAGDNFPGLMGHWSLGLQGSSMTSRPDTAREVSNPPCVPPVWYGPQETRGQCLLQLAAFSVSKNPQEKDLGQRAFVIFIVEFP